MKKDRWLILLAMALLAILLALFFLGSRNTSVEPEKVPETEETVVTEDPEIITDEENTEGTAEEMEYLNVPLDEFKEYADSSSGLWEFIQRFYDDVIVYKTSGGKFIYEPINRDLPQSDYDWSNLKEVGLDSREVQYVEDGQVTSIKGIDVSKYQEEIDWEKVAESGVKFAIIRLGYRGYSSGNLVLDECFEYNVAEALRNGIEVGVYFVTQAVSEEEAVEEAEFVLDNIAPYNVTWPIVLDLEDAGSDSARTLLLTAEQRTDYVRAFCERIKQAGKKPMLYFNIVWLLEKLDITRLTDYDKWFAQYFNVPFFPYEFQMWQYTNTGKIDGINGNVDMNISFVDYSKGE